MYLQRKTCYFTDVNSFQSLSVGLRGMLQSLMPGPARVCLICPTQEQAESDSSWWSFPAPQRSLLQAGEDFLPRKSHFRTWHPPPSLVFLPSFSGRFLFSCPASPRWQGALWSYLDYVWRISTLHPPILPQQLLVSPLLEGVSFKLLSSQAFCLCYLLP